MVETIWGKQSYEERVADYEKSLAKSSIGAVIELAATLPGSPMDAPFAPIDPALNAAAQKLVREVGLQDEVSRLRRM